MVSITNSSNHTANTGNPNNNIHSLKTSSTTDITKGNTSKLQNDFFKQKYYNMKLLSFNHLTAKQHLFLAICRDISLSPSIWYLFKSLNKTYLIIFHGLNNFNYNEFIANNQLINMDKINNTQILNTNKENIFIFLNSLVTARASEYLLCALWCLVSLYLSFATLDSLMLRWILKYSIIAAILRMFSMSLILITLQLFLINSLSPDRDYYLHTWILISCILTIIFIWQNYLTSNLSNDSSKTNKNTNNEISNNDKNNSNDNNTNNKNNEYIGTTSGININNVHHSIPNIKQISKRQLDFYNIIVFCVVPVGIASFITMLCLMRNLFIQRLDIEQLISFLDM